MYVRKVFPDIMAEFIKLHKQKSVNATLKSAYVWFALLMDHGASCVRLNASWERFKETLTKAILPLKQLSTQTSRKRKDLK